MMLLVVEWMVMTVGYHGDLGNLLHLSFAYQMLNIRELLFIDISNCKMAKGKLLIFQQSFMFVYYIFMNISNYSEQFSERNPRICQWFVVYFLWSRYWKQGSQTERRGCSDLLLINRFSFCVFEFFFWRFVVALDMWIECDDDDGGLHIQFSFFFIDNILLNFLYSLIFFLCTLHEAHLNARKALFLFSFIKPIWGMFINVQCRDSSWVTLNRQTRKTKSINSFMTHKFSYSIKKSSFSSPAFLWRHCVTITCNNVCSSNIAYFTII